LTVGQCHLPTRNAGGTLSRSAYSAKSTYVSKAFPAAGTAAMIDAVVALGNDVPGVGGGITFDSYGGAISQVGVTDTAFVHRNVIACAQYSVAYASTSPSPAIVAGARSWLDQTQSTFAPYAQGSYQNYIDPTLPNWAQAYYGVNLPRLMRVKKSYDPDAVFRFAQSIPLPAN
jgi:hypothetical protein